MSTLVTQLYLLEKYGPRLTTEQLAEVLTSDAGTILNQVNGWITLCELPFRSSSVATSPAEPSLGRRPQPRPTGVRRRAPWHPRF